MQQAKPKNAKGVEVILETLDPNGNFYEIGRVTSDMNGNFGFMWEPPVPGTYQIIARFAGSAAYGPSSATTYIGITEAPSPAQPIEPEPAEPETPTEEEKPEEPEEPPAEVEKEEVEKEEDSGERDSLSADAQPPIPIPIDPEDRPIKLEEDDGLPEPHDEERGG